MCIGRNLRDYSILKKNRGVYVAMWTRFVLIMIVPPTPKWFWKKVKKKKENTRIPNNLFHNHLFLSIISHPIFKSFPSLFSNFFPPYFPIISHPIFPLLPSLFFHYFPPYFHSFPSLFFNPFPAYFPIISHPIFP